MNIRDIRNMTDDDLANQIIDLKEQLYKLRFQKTMGQLANPMLIRDARRDLARINLVQRERALQKETK
jgi:large subunit ribosomal protein L29